MGRFCVLVFLLLGLAVSASADETMQSLSKEHLPSITSLADGNFRLQWPDGRVAQTQVDATEPIVGEFKVSLRESTCLENEDVAPIAYCTINFPFIRVVPRLIWVQNPNSSKIGKDVVRKDSASKILDDEIYFDAFSKMAHPDFLKLLPNVQLTCDRWEWLPPHKDLTPFEVIDWSVQNMFQNGQTELVENRLNTVTQDVSAHWKNEKTLEFINNETRMSSEGLSYLIGDMIAWTLETQNGGLCEVDLTRGPIDHIQALVNSGSLTKLTHTEDFWQEFNKRQYHYAGYNYGYSGFGSQKALAMQLDNFELIKNVQYKTSEQGTQIAEFSVMEVE